ncbi:rhodanese-like domain-containing protein [Chloroflexota bacterium]
MRQRSSAMLMLFILLVSGVLLITSCAENQNGAPGQETPIQIIQDITPQEAFTLIKENTDNSDFIIIDVRTPNEFTDGHIKDAINMDFMSDEFRDNIGKLDRDRTYLIYCRTANRSRGAVDIMEELRFQSLYHMLGGITQWENDGLPVIQ